MKESSFQAVSFQRFRATSNMCSEAKPCPSREEIVTSLMVFVGKESRRHKDKGTGQVAVKKYLKYCCPKPNCISPILSFLDKSGFNNSYAHLRGCYWKGLGLFSEQDSVALELYQQAREVARIEGGTIRSHFTLWSLSEDKKTVHSYLRPIL